MARADAVELVELHLGEPREELQECDAGVVDVVVGPARREARDERARFLDQLGPRPVVEPGDCEAWLACLHPRAHHVVAAREQLVGSDPTSSLSVLPRSETQASTRSTSSIRSSTANTSSS
jgi:hypothetical protein